MSVLARTEANQFVDLLISGFGFEDPGVQEEESTSKEPKSTDPTKYKSALKQATAESSEGPPSKRLRSSTAVAESKYFKEEVLHPLDSAKITVVKPTDHKSLLHVGVPDIFSYRIKEGNEKGYYGCAYQEVAPSQGLPLDEKECQFSASNKVGVTTHLCRCHLGIALQCPLCQKVHRYFDAVNWRRHMEEKHHNVPEAQWFA